MSQEDQLQNKEELLYLLEDADVQRRILEIVHSERTSKPAIESGAGTKDVQKYQRELDLLRQEYEEAKDRWALERERLDFELDRVRKEYRTAEDSWKKAESELKTSQDKINALQQETEQLKPLKPFLPVLMNYRGYRALSLPEELKESLRGSLPDDSAARFWAAACQRDSLIRFWDTVKSRCEILSEQQRGELCKLLQFCMDQYNSVWNTPVYELIPDGAGVAFDEQRHSRSSRCSLHFGTIERVLLPGIWNVRWNKAERKSVVEY